MGTKEDPTAGASLPIGTAQPGSEAGGDVAGDGTRLDAGDSDAGSSESADPVVPIGVVPGGVAPWDSPSNGNPFLPGYFADPSIFYDADSQLFYVFATTDGNWIAYSAEPTVWYSSDFVSWKSQALSLPAIWPTPPLWAPSVIKHPTNGQYYLLYACGAIGTCIGRSASPLGPWVNATAGTTTASAPLYRQGEMFGANDWFDAQFFVDGDRVYMTFGGGGGVGVAALAFAEDLSVTIDDSDPRMTDGTLHEFKRLTGLTNYLEGSVMFKSGAQYFVTYSNSACQNYNVQYAVGSSPVGPFTHAEGTILQRDDAKNVLGPGHNSILQYGNDWYIVYHRQHYPYVDVKRQTAIDRLRIDGTTISTGVQTQEGVFAGDGALEALVRKGRAAAERDLAFGKQAVASSVSDFKGGVSGNIRETFPALSGFYAARYAVDHNNGTRWAPTTLPASLVVDLGADVAVGRCETTFEYVRRAYSYRIEYLTQADAGSITAAQTSTLWRPYADRTNDAASSSPVVDVNPTTARYLRITVLGADIPSAAAEIPTILQTDFADRVSIVEFKAFERASAP